MELDIALKEVDVDGTSESRPVCEAIRVERNPARPPLSGNELRRMPINNWVDFACTEAALRHAGPGLLTPITSDEESRDAVADIQSTRRRRRITDALLRDVSTVYLETGSNAEAVREEFHVSQAQAFRYVRMARERGLLPKGDD